MPIVTIPMRPGDPNNYGIVAREQDRQGLAGNRAVLRMISPITLYLPGAPTFYITVNLPFAPVSTRHSQLSPNFANVDRAGRQSLLVFANQQLEQISFQAVIVNDWSPGYASCDGKLDALRILATLPTDLVFAYGTSGTGKRWKMTDFSYETNTRDPKTSAVLRATADITLTESVAIGSSIVPGLQRLSDGAANRVTGASSSGQRNAAMDSYDADAEARRIRQRQLDAMAAIK